jgi:ABC-type Mn2+/Zn2+ transport system ATPase subunit
VTLPGEPLLTCRDVLLGYGAPILPAVNVALRAGELWAIVGLNGAGKSTWMRTALGLQSALGGSIIRAPGLRVAYVPQQAALDPIYPVRARDVVEMGTLGAGRLLGFATAGERRRGMAALERVGIPHLAGKALRDLSGGERQRVLIARAIASGANLFFLDEPTSALDYHAEIAVLDLIDGLRRVPGAAVALITHQMQVLRGRADRALLLDREHQAVVLGTADEVAHSDEFIHLFGQLATARHGASPGGPA